MNPFAKGGLAAGMLLGAAVLGLAAFELVAGVGSGWLRIPAGIVVVAFAAALGWGYTRPDVHEDIAQPARPKSQPAVAMSYGFAGEEDPELEAIVARTMKALPREFQEQVTNLAFVIEDEPPAGKPWLATYQGIPLTEKSVMRSWEWPHRITIYRGPLRRVAGADPEQFEGEVAHTIRHELAHYFGISDERLVELGAY